MYSAILQNKIPPNFTFFQKSLLRNFWYEVRHSMIKSASIVRNLSKIHTFRTIASILIDTKSRFPANFIWSFCDFQSNYSLPEASIHELYSTLIRGGEHIISSQIDRFISFARKIVSLPFDLLHWWNVRYTLIRCILSKEGSPVMVAYFFYKRKIRIASICTAKELQL